MAFLRHAASNAYNDRTGFVVSSEVRNQLIRDCVLTIAISWKFGGPQNSAFGARGGLMLSPRPKICSKLLGRAA